MHIIISLTQTLGSGISNQRGIIWGSDKGPMACWNGPTLSAHEKTCVPPRNAWGLRQAGITEHWSRARNTWNMSIRAKETHVYFQINEIWENVRSTYLCPFPYLWASFYPSVCPSVHHPVVYITFEVQSMGAHCIEPWVFGFCIFLDGSVFNAQIQERKVKIGSLQVGRDRSRSLSFFFNISFFHSPLKTV